ncbi:MAG: hypothetical protein ACR2QF_05735, partial [Geminicoccaceae bacterium]
IDPEPFAKKHGVLPEDVRNMGNRFAAVSRARRDWMQAMRNEGMLVNDIARIVGMRANSVRQATMPAYADASIELAKLAPDIQEIVKHAAEEFEVELGYVLNTKCTYRDAVNARQRVVYEIWKIVGHEPKRIADMIGFDSSTIGDWCRRFRGNGGFVASSNANVLGRIRAPKRCAEAAFAAFHATERRVWA